MRKILCLLFLCGILVGCSDTSFNPINSSTDFVASLNTIEPSIDFISNKHKIIQTWKLEAAYTGFTLVSKDYIFLYGYSLNEAVLIQLSTGKKVATYSIHEGSSFAYAVGDSIYVANGKENTVTLLDLKGKEVEKAEAGRYPMSMIADEKYLYVINFKDTFLSVFTLKDLQLVTTWDIPTSSHGLYMNGNELWIGGHGAGSQPNKVIRKYNLQSGQLQGEIEASMMPIGFAQASNGQIYVVSHGSNYVREFTKEGDLMSSIKVGANPFSINTFDDTVVVAGYDDHDVYFLQNGKIINKVSVGKGPFQLITREASK
ncbi:YncE family protein [Psychrobacillus sp. L4]|uniref:YncE family protein n=1 Tax=Psychrobacillus sp. L4 TaxID=3236892 RepID=UPI0036F34073